MCCGQAAKIAVPRVPGPQVAHALHWRSSIYGLPSHSTTVSAMFHLNLLGERVALDVYPSPDLSGSANSRKKKEKEKRFDSRNQTYTLDARLMTVIFLLFKFRARARSLALVVYIMHRYKRSFL